jgi:N-methylhydantoinase A
LTAPGAPGSVEFKHEADRGQATSPRRERVSETVGTSADATRRYRVAVDTGGTFTDAFFFDERTARTFVTKVPSTPAHPERAVMASIEAAGIRPSEIVLLTHGTTVATNALLTRRLARAALVATKGFRDVVEIRDGTKPDLWDAYADVTPP